MEIVADENSVFDDCMTTECHPAHVPKRRRTTFIFLVNRSYDAFFVLTAFRIFAQIEVPLRHSPFAGAFHWVDEIFSVITN